MAERAVVTAKASGTKQKCPNSCKQNFGFSSSESTADRILQLQRTAGNQAVQKLIKSRALQAKLRIGQPNDIYEQEADRVAEQVMRIPEPMVQRQTEKDEEEETIQAKPIAQQITPLVQRQSEEEEKEVQTKRNVDENPEIKKVKENTAFDPFLDLIIILGLPEKKSIQYSEEKIRKLYKYLKKIRKFAPEKEDITKNLLEEYFPSFGLIVWEQSKKPLAGYVGTSKGIEAARRLKVATGLGLEKSQKRGWRKKFLGSDVIFFSGHHYAGFGFPGEFEGLDVSKMKFLAPKVKLIMISSCSGLAPNAIKLWREKFPNAYILGWRRSSPLSQMGTMSQFLMNLPEDLILEEKQDIMKILNEWEIYIEKLAAEKKDIKPIGLGYATPEGKVKYYTKINGKWQWVDE